MGIKLEIDARELSKITQETAGISLRAKDIAPAATGIKLLIQEDVDTRFQSAPNTSTGGDAFGGVYWEELSESYMRSHPYRRNSQLLRDTGELLQSLTIDGHPYHVEFTSPSEIVFGSALAKAGRLNRDRPFIFWHPLLIEKVAEFLVSYLA